MSVPLSPDSEARRLRKAARTLLFLSPLCGEIVSGSTPVSNLLSPVGVIVFGYYVTLYGCGALLCRELCRRRGLGYLNIWVLGLAYGVLEEGLVVQSWFNPAWPDLVPLQGYGRLADLNWIWAGGLTLFHATFSVLIAVVVAEMLFPDIGNRPWLGRRGMRWTVLVLALSSLAGFLLFKPHGLFVAEMKAYTQIPGSYVFAVIALAGFAAWGLLWRPRPQPALPRRPWGVWSLRAASVAVSFLFVVEEYGSHDILRGAAPIAFLVIVLTGVLGVRAVRRHARRQGFSTRHVLALCAGPPLLFSCLSLARGPLQPVDILFTVGALYWLSYRWAPRIERRNAAAGLGPIGASSPPAI